MQSVRRRDEAEALSDDASLSNSTSNDIQDRVGQLVTKTAKYTTLANESETLGDVSLVKEITDYLERGYEPHEEKQKSIAEVRSLQTLSYLIMVEERLRRLESKHGNVDVAEYTRPEQPLRNMQEAMPPPWTLAPAWMMWDEFLYSMPPAGSQVHGRWTRSPPSIFDVVVGPVPTSVKAIGVQLASDEIPISFPIVSPDARKIERIRINSDFLCDVLRSLMGTGSRMRYRTHIRPFKLLLTYEDDIREYLAKLRLAIERRKSAQSQPSVAMLGRIPSGSNVLDHSSAQSDIDTNTGAASSVDVDKDTADHLECLLSFMDEYLREEIGLHRLLQTRANADKSAQVAFKDLWSLFGPGDCIFDPVASQAFRVLTVHDGRRKLRNRAVGPFPPATSITIGGLAPPSTAALVQDEVSSFVITCFYLDFDGKEAGPVQKSIAIAPFDNMRDITSLKVFPIEYASVQNLHVSFQGTYNRLVEADSLLEALSKRGRKFASLADSYQVAHKEYNGLSLGIVQEQIDSEVIIDLDLYYRDNPALMPVLGIFPTEEGDYRETSETFPVFGGYDDWDLNLFDDRGVDKARKMKFLNTIQEVTRFHSNQEHVKEQFAMLFPPFISGFVLKSRDWYPLDVKEVRDLPFRRQDFDDLILPDGYKDLVESLVKNHSKGAKPVQGVEVSRKDAENTHREDIVRGKGKGTIILLHGVPGVGKTSTAECVAEYTQRPLFALTCGDIGETPQQVQDNLTKNFYLAHRWGCVMLLDEADVFLQSRDKRDLKRNAVVSVFLRILEYYSGILFLTTNKVGNFDEAFKSRIHVSLYYRPLSSKQTKKIWEVNLRRIKESKPHIAFDDAEILDWVKKFRATVKKDGLRTWNGRQIHNACQTAVALAEFRDQGKLGVKHLNAVAKASKEFDLYLKATHGMDDMERAEVGMERGDDAFERLVSGKMKHSRNGKRTSKKRRQ